MAKVTSKYQVTIPKRIAESHRLHPGDEFTWRDTAEAILLVPEGVSRSALSVEDRLELFDSATARLLRKRSRRKRSSQASGRGWKREDLYDRARTR